MKLLSMVVIIVPLVYRFFKGNFYTSNFVLKGSVGYAIIQKLSFLKKFISNETCQEMKK